MRKLEVAVCDTEEGYRSRFATYLVEHKSREMMVETFSVVEGFLEELKKRSFDLVVFGKGFEQVFEEAKQRKLPCILLKDTMPDQFYEGESYEREGRKDYVELFRYQPVDAILHEMQALSGARLLEQEQIHGCEAGVELIGVCSSAHHEMQMPFALIYAAELAKKRKTLYINLMEQTGALELLGLMGQYDMGDIMVRLRNHRLMSEVFCRCIYELEGIHYILNKISLITVTSDNRETPGSLNHYFI